MARVGRVGTQRLGLPLALVRADSKNPSTGAHARALLRAAVQAMIDHDTLVLDAGFEIRQLQAAGATRYVVRAAKNVTGRWASLPELSGAGVPTQAGRVDPPACPDLPGP